MSIDLGERDERLTGVYLIKGIGSSNVYAISKGEVTLIDTGVGNEDNLIAPKLDDVGVRIEDVSQVVLTHAHRDHVGGLFEILHFASPRVLIHSLDARFLEGMEVERLVKLEDGDIIKTEGQPLTVYHTPGHTAGSICLYESRRKLLFSGDTVFSGGRFGRYDLRTGSYNAMLSSLKRLTTSSIEILLPGHGEPVLRNAGEHVRRALEAAVYR